MSNGPPPGYFYYGIPVPGSQQFMQGQPYPVPMMMGGPMMHPPPYMPHQFMGQDVSGGIPQQPSTSEQPSSVQPDDEPESKKRKKKKSKKNKHSEPVSAKTLGDLVEHAKKTSEKSKEKRKRKRNGSSSDEDILDKAKKNSALSGVRASTDTPGVSNADGEAEEPINDDVFVLTEEDLAHLDDIEEVPPKSVSVKELKEPLSVSLCEEYYGTASTSTDVLKRFESDVRRAIRSEKEAQPIAEKIEAPEMHTFCKCGHSSNSETSESEQSGDEQNDTTKMNDKQKLAWAVTQEVNRKRQHPSALSPDLGFNEPDMTNDGALCRCSFNARKKGIRHNIFAGEQRIESCLSNQGSSRRLYHYVLRVNPSPSSHSTRPSTISHSEQSYMFDGFSVYLHRPAPDNLPMMPANRFSREYSFEFFKAPDDVLIGTVEEMEAFHDYLFIDILELFDLSRRAFGVEDGCPFYHLAPRYLRRKAGNPSDILPLCVVLEYYNQRYADPLCSQSKSASFSDRQNFRSFCVEEKGQVLINPSKKPSSIRVDAFDLGPNCGASNEVFIVHNGSRPNVYTLHNRPDYQSTVRRLTRMRRIVRGRKEPTEQDRFELARLESLVQQLNKDSQQLRDCVIRVPIEGFHRTGIYPDVVQHAAIVVLAVSHIRYHWSLEVFEHRISYKFHDRNVLELAFTHPSFRKNFGMNHDQARNALVNCGLRGQTHRDVEKRENSKKKGFSTLVEIMSKHGSKKEEVSSVAHNERLEFLGDSVVEFVNTVHLYFLFQDLQEGGLATYRTAIVQNRNLANLAKKLGMDDFMLYSHGGDLCHEAEMKHAMANAFEAVMAAIYLDGGVLPCQRIFAEAMFEPGTVPFDRWINLPEHRLKVEHPEGDRHLIEATPQLKQLTELEDAIGVQFEHIRVLARALTRRNVPLNNLTHGHNQRMEFLGDSVAQLIVSDYLYRHFPTHHEGHLSLLRTCLVSNRTLAVVCDDLNLGAFLVQGTKRRWREVTLRTKDKADLVEALLGAIYVDRGWDYCKAFCKVCLFPRLKYFIGENKWNDPKSLLQQACIALREGKGEPEVPEYKTITCHGPANTRLFQVAVYFRCKRLAVGEGSTVQAAQMHAAEKALEENGDLFHRIPGVPNKQKAAKLPSLLDLPPLQCSLMSMPPPSHLPGSVVSGSGSGSPAVSVGVPICSAPNVMVPSTMYPMGVMYPQHQMTFGGGIQQVPQSFTTLQQPPPMGFQQPPPNFSGGQFQVQPTAYPMFSQPPPNFVPNSGVTGGTGRSSGKYYQNLKR